ncbi:outer membrane beta-barrel protein [Xenorhabdus kozodoii]|uniref:Resistance to complement killing n=1 Tax=Xenorhabdus kozodoii TaxID=351676 RepID=A0A2D0LHA4_9GAMM|nr:outer membrane beta-barrel protein [Xenorhabdus kozodoii]PHM75096.1 resistance to complement killing [Xenorhabdus kozodoii]
MNKAFIAMFVPFMLLATLVCIAEGQAASVGDFYNQTGHFGEGKLNRMNFDRRYEVRPDWSIMAPLLAGTSYRINHYLSLYGTVGIARLEWDRESSRGTYFDTYTYPGKNTALAWGTGALLNPFEDVTFYIGYEEIQLKPENENYHVNNFNFGISYHF